MSRPSILIVDTSDAAREAIAEALRDHGYSTLVASNTRDVEMITAAVSAAPRLALLDFDSRLRGTEALAQSLRRLWPELRIVYLAGVSPNDDDTLERALRVPATSLLLKPTSLDAIVELVHGHMSDFDGAPGDG